MARTMQTGISESLSHLISSHLKSLNTLQRMHCTALHCSAMHREGAPKDEAEWAFNTIRESTNSHPHPHLHHRGAQMSDVIQAASPGRQGGGGRLPSTAPASSETGSPTRLRTVGLPGGAGSSPQYGGKRPIQPEPQPSASASVLIPGIGSSTPTPMPSALSSSVQNASLSHTQQQQLQFANGNGASQGIPGPLANSHVAPDLNELDARVGALTINNLNINRDLESAASASASLSFQTTAPNVPPSPNLQPRLSAIQPMSADPNVCFSLEPVFWPLLHVLYTYSSIQTVHVFRSQPDPSLHQFGIVCYMMST